VAEMVLLDADYLYSLIELVFVQTNLLEILNEYDVFREKIIARHMYRRREGVVLSD
jgi:hypothetical protein